VGRSRVGRAPWLVWQNLQFGDDLGRLNFDDGCAVCATQELAARSSHRRSGITPLLPSKLVLKSPQVAMLIPDG
jgi:hypothetical protein